MKYRRHDGSRGGPYARAREPARPANEQPTLVGLAKSCESTPAGTAVTRRPPGADGSPSCFRVTRRRSATGRADPQRLLRCSHAPASRSGRPTDCATLQQFPLAALASALATFHHHDGRHGQTGDRASPRYFAAPRCGHSGMRSTPKAATMCWKSHAHRQRRQAAGAGQAGITRPPGEDAERAPPAPTRFHRPRARHRGRTPE